MDDHLSASRHALSAAPLLPLPACSSPLLSVLFSPTPVASITIPHAAVRHRHPLPSGRPTSRRPRASLQRRALTPSRLRAGPPAPPTPQPALSPPPPTARLPLCTPPLLSRCAGHHRSWPPSPPPRSAPRPTPPRPAPRPAPRAPRRGRRGAAPAAPKIGPQNLP